MEGVDGETEAVALGAFPPGAAPRPITATTAPVARAIADTDRDIAFRLEPTPSHMSMLAIPHGVFLCISEPKTAHLG